MKISELTNAEILFLYYRQTKFVEIHDSLVYDLKHGIHNPLISDSFLDLNKLINNPHIAMIRSINDKLQPIVELIEESFPDMRAEALALVDNPLNLEDDSEEEDL